MAKRAPSLKQKKQFQECLDLDLESHLRYLTELSDALPVYRIKEAKEQAEKFNQIPEAKRLTAVLDEIKRQNVRLNEARNRTTCLLSEYGFPVSEDLAVKVYGANASKFAALVDAENSVDEFFITVKLSALGNLKKTLTDSGSDMEEEEDDGFNSVPHAMEAVSSDDEL